MISAVCQGSRHRFVADQNLSARSACPCPVGPVGRRDDDAAARAALMLILLIRRGAQGKGMEEREKNIPTTVLYIPPRTGTQHVVCRRGLHAKHIGCSLLHSGQCTELNSCGRQVPSKFTPTHTRTLPKPAESGWACRECVTSLDPWFLTRNNSGCHGPVPSRIHCIPQPLEGSWTRPREARGEKKNVI